MNVLIVSASTFPFSPCGPSYVADLVNNNPFLKWLVTPGDRNIEKANKCVNWTLKTHKNSNIIRGEEHV